MKKPLKKANYVKEITVVDPDTHGSVSVAIYKHENGGMFGIDASYLDEIFDDERNPIIRDPFNSTGNVELH